jgi:hypothetical protein
MVEMIAIFACIGWLILVAIEWLGSLPCFPAILVATVLIPGVSFFDYRSLGRTWKLSALGTHREPIPPERFYWITQQKRTKWMIQISSVVTVLSWANVVLLPATFELSVSSVYGWANAAIAICATSRLTSATALFFRASQWFDAMRPTLVGAIRMAMYQLSDNYEYLGPQKRKSKKDTVY